nr:RNA polymerase beta'' subunit [Oedogonium sp. 260-2_chl]
MLFFMILKKPFNELKKKYLIIYRKKNICSTKPYNKLIRKTSKKKITNFKLNYFWNQSFDKSRLKIFVFWCFQNYGQNKTVKVLEILKHLGFQYATKAGLSLSIDDLIIPPTKSKLLIDAELVTRTAMIQYKNAQITNLERFQKIIETWHITSEKMKEDMIHYFKTTNIFNPLYMMAFSGARGNVSQVRQLVGMRGLMANPQGQILDFPIRSNFREGLTLTEYVISCYGARKGVVDTALRTANAGYLTRRLVDVAQHIIISNFDCGTNRGLIVSEMKQGNKILFSLRQRLLGRVLAKDVVSGNLLIARKNQEISDNLSEIIASFVKTVIIRSPLTCKTTQFICQRCYGWSLAEGKLVSVGETVGIIAAQSIGEPGTQLTMRTFHTGGVFAGELLDQFIAPFDAIVKYNIYIPGNLIRTPQGTIAFLTRIESQLILQNCIHSKDTKYYTIPPYTILFIRNGETVSKNQLIAQLCTFSPSLKNTSNNFIEYKIYSDLEGEIKSTNLKVLKKITEMNDIMHRSLQWGFIWILSGKIYQLPFNSIDALQIKSSLKHKNNFFPIQGDFLTESSILSKVIWINNLENIKLNFEKKTNLYQKFTNNKKIFFNHCTQRQKQWLEKWEMFSDRDRFIKLNKSIKKFTKTLESRFQESLINVYAQNLLLFLTIEKIRYEQLGYFIIFKKKYEKKSLKKLNLLRKYDVKKKENIIKIKNSSFIQQNIEKYTAQLKYHDHDYITKIFISIPLEYNKNQQTSLITPPKFFYQKQSNIFFEWFSDQSHLVDSGFIHFSDIFLFQNKKQLKKDTKKKQETINVRMIRRRQQNAFLHSNKIQQNYHQYLFRNDFKSYSIQHNMLFLYSFTNNNEIKYLNSCYSIILFLCRFFIECQKQQLSNFQFLKTNKNFYCFSSLKKSILKKSMISLSRKKSVRIQFLNCKKVFDIEKQFFNDKIVEGGLSLYPQFHPNKYIRFNTYHKKNKILKQEKNSEIINLTKFGISKKFKSFTFQKNEKKKPGRLKKMNKTNPSKKSQYIALNPISFFYKIFNRKNVLLKKYFYNQLQLRIFFKNPNSVAYHTNEHSSLLFILSTNYLTEKIFFYLYQSYIPEKTKKKFFKNLLIFKKFSHIFINLYTFETTSKKIALFCYKSILNKFFYINLNNIWNKQKLFKKCRSKKNFDKSKEIRNIKNIKKFYSSFTYYIIKNQVRFAPSFQAQSINQLENLYKKEIQNMSNFNLYTQKLLLIKQLKKNFFSCFIKKLKTNISQKKSHLSKTQNLILLHSDSENTFNKYDFPKLVNEIEKSKEGFKNKKLSNNLIRNNDYLTFLFKQIIKFSTYIFTKKKQKQNFLYFDYKQKKIENTILNNHRLINLINCKKYVPILLIKYKKNNITMNFPLFHTISIFKHFLIRKQYKGSNLKGKMLNNNQDGLINNKINHFILKMYIRKLNSLKNIIINYYFKLVSFKWLLMECKLSLGKTKIFNPIFFKRLNLYKFINKNTIISHDDLTRSPDLMKTYFLQQKTNKQKKFNKSSKNNIFKKSKEKFLLYSRFSLISQQYVKCSKKQLSILIFNPQQKRFDKTLNILLTKNIWVFSNINTLSLFQKSLFDMKKFEILNKKVKLKKILKILTLTNFLNIKKIQININFLSKKKILQKINKFIFNFLNIFYYKQVQIFQINRQYQFLSLNLKYYYGILKFEKKNKESFIFELSQEKLSKGRNICYSSKKSTKIVKKPCGGFENQTKFLLTNKPGWICKPIKNLKTKSFYLKKYSNTNIYFIYKLLQKKLIFLNFNYIHFFHSIKIDYRVCENNLTWLNYTFLKMIELVKTFSKSYDKETNLSYFSLSFLYTQRNAVKSNQVLKFLKKKVERTSKNYYYWLINKRARFIKMEDYLNITKNYGIKKGINNTDFDQIFSIMKVQEFILNNYQNLSYFYHTNLLFLSRIKLLKLFEEKNQPNLCWNNNGLILKYQFHSSFLNKQKVSKKLISKFPNLELTVEQHLNFPAKKLTNISRINITGEPVLLSNHKKLSFSSLMSHGIQIKNFEKNNKILNQIQLKAINQTNKILKLQKPIKIYRHFLGFFIPMNFDFSFQSCNISWNFFPNYNLLNLKFEKKQNSTYFLTYLSFKNKILKQIEFKKSPDFGCLQLLPISTFFINISSCLKMLLRQPCFDWSATQYLNIGYKKNIFFAPTKTFLLLSSHYYFNNNNQIALTQLYSGLKGEVLYSLQMKKQKVYSTSLNTIKSESHDTILLTESSLKSETSLFLTRSDQICLKFKNEINLNFHKKFKIFKTHKHIRSLKIFQIKSVKQVILILKILQKIHNNCQYSNQSINLILGLFVFQGDLLNTIFRNSSGTLRPNKKLTNHMKSIIVNHSGQIIHFNKFKITLRKGQPIFFSPNCIFHSYNNDFIQQNKPVLSLPYQQLKTGDIVQGIPKIEQLFEARLTFAGKLEFDNLTNILEILFQTYQNKLQINLAVRRSIELIQMIIINSIQRIYRSQGVNISDKHLEVIVKQMTKKVEILDSAQSGFLIGEHFDLDVVELWNSKLPKTKHVKYKPLILGISKASLQTDSFLSAASFQYTTRILSQAAFFKKRDFLKGLKENIIVGNIIPAGTGYLGDIEDLFKTN